MDLITRQRFPGQRLDFRIWEETGWGDGMFARVSTPEVCSVESSLACSTWVPAAGPMRRGVWLLPCTFPVMKLLSCPSKLRAALGVR